MLTHTKKPMDIERQRSLHRRARLFRKLATPAEHFLWQHIKDKQISDLRIELVIGQNELSKIIHNKIKALFPGEEERPTTKLKVR